MAAKRAWLLIKPVLLVVVVGPLWVFAGVIWLLVVGYWAGTFVVAIPAVIIGGIAEVLWNAAAPDRWELHGVFQVLVAVLILGVIVFAYLGGLWESRHEIVRNIGARVGYWRQRWAQAAVWPPPSRVVIPPPTPAAPPAPRPNRLPLPDDPPPRRAIPAPIPSTKPRVGRRAWRIGLEPRWKAADPLAIPVLRAVSHGTIWWDAELEATCERGRHPAPDFDCQCGIYAVKQTVPVPSYATRGLTAVGTVELSGRVLEGSRGYRAQRARVIGPLRLETTCIGESRLRECHHPVVAIEVSADSITPRCTVHSRDRHELLDPAHVLPVVAARLELRYGVTVNQQGGTDEHR